MLLKNPAGQSRHERYSFRHGFDNPNGKAQLGNNAWSRRCSYFRGFFTWFHKGQTLPLCG
jgi:hypothetical protein